MYNPHLIRRGVDHITRNRYRYVALSLVVFLCYQVLCAIGGRGAATLECNTTHLPAEALPGTGPLCIAFVADIHNNPTQLREALAMLQQQKPDLIVLGGDLVNAYERFMRTRWAVSSLQELAALAPTYAILGNHDYEKQEQVERVYHTAGVKLLRNEALDFPTPGGATLRIVGLGDWNEGDEAPQRCMSAAGAETKPVLLLSHDPESRWLLQEYDWDLMLSGHNHGGQLGIPFTDIYLSFRSSMPAGLFDFGKGRRIFVSRGIGSVMNMRFFCPPEVNILRIGE